MIKLYAENFRSFPKIDWEIPSGLTLIDGVNKDTGGSNMAGKTTLLDAWFWCRYGWLPKWKGPKGGSADAVLRRKNNEIVGATLVRVIEQIGSDTICIERHRPNRLKIWKNNIEQYGMDQKGLESLIGSPDRFLICIYLPQRRQRSFYWMGDNDRTELISIVAGLEDIERASQEAKILRDEASDSIDQLKFRIEVLENQSKELPVKISEMSLRHDDIQKQFLESSHHAHQSDILLDEFIYNGEKLIREEVNSKIDPLIERISDIIFQVKSLQNNYDLQKKKLDNFPKLDPRYKEKVDKIRQKIKESNEVLSKIGSIQCRISSEASLAEEAAAGICSSCQQLLPEETRNKKSIKHWNNVEILRQELSKTERPDLVSLEGELILAEKNYEEFKSENEKEPFKIMAILSDLKSQLEQKKLEERMIQRDIQSVKDEVLGAWNKKKSELSQKVELAYKEKTHHDLMLKSILATLDSLKSDQDKNKNIILSLDQEIVGWKNKFEQAVDLVEIFGPKGYRSVCFDGLIEKLGDRAGQLLSVMTQGLYSTRLDQIGQDSKGNQKIILKPVIIKGGSEVPLDDLSGGAEERVALAYDVAISEAAGEGMPLLLDEVLGGLDAVGKIEAMTLLEEVSKTRPVLVVDHSTEFKSMFSKVIRVIYENEESHLEDT